MRLGLAEHHAHAQDGAFAIRADADGDEHGAVHQQAAMAHLFVACVEDKVRARTQRALTPELELHVELGRAGAYLRGADLMAAEFLDDFGDFARRDALHIHLLRCAHPCGAACGWLSPCGRFSHHKGESLLAAHAALQRAGIEVDAVTHLGDAQLDSAHARGEGFGLEAIGMTEPPFAALIGLGLEHGGAFLVHGLVE